MNSYPAEALSGANPADLAWFEGNWVGQVGDDRAEERWSG